MKHLLIKGNSKMGQKVHLFNLPPHLTCKPTKWCLHGLNGKPACYARRNNFILPSVKKSMLERYKASKRKDFVERMILELKQVTPLYFRWHSSGDFSAKNTLKRLKKL